MMNRKIYTIILCTFFGIFLLIPLATAQSSKVITLTDGSIIKGNIVAFEKGSYIVQSTKMGQISIKDSDIISIVAANAPQQQFQNQFSSSPLTGLSNQMGQMEQLGQGGQMNQLMQRVIMDADIMEAFMKIMEDPEIRTLFTDQQLLNKILSFDLDAINNDKRLQGIMQNPKMQEFMETVNQKLNLSP